MSKQAGVALAVTAKSARADEAIQKMVVGDGNKLFDALTDNGGGMEDALASTEVPSCPVDVSASIPNWKQTSCPTTHEGGFAAASTIRHEGKVVRDAHTSRTPDSMAYDYKALGFHPDSWGVHVRLPVQGAGGIAERLRPDP